MNDQLVSIDCLKESLQPYLTSKNNRILRDHLRFFNRILQSSSIMTFQSKRLLSEGVTALQSNDYWLQLEIEAQCLSHNDDLLLRRCLKHFASVLDHQNIRPSIVKVSSTNIDCLMWYRRSLVLGVDISKAIHLWEYNSELEHISILTGAYNALKFLTWVFENDKKLAKSLCNIGLVCFGDAAQYNCTFKRHQADSYKNVWKVSLLAILAAYLPQKFKPHTLVVSGIQCDVTDLYYLSPICIEQLTEVACGSRVLGKKEHNKESIIRRFKKTIYSIKLVFFKHKNNRDILRLGLDAFIVNNYALLKEVKNQVSRYQFNELVLLLGDYLNRPIHKHHYLPNLLPFYYATLDKYRTVNFTDLANKSPKLFSDVCELHKSEVELLYEKDNSIVTLHSYFMRLKILLINMVLPEHKHIANNLGLACLSANKNNIQKRLFQEVQFKVKSKEITLKTGFSIFEVIRWVMKVTRQEVVDVYLLSSKHHQQHAKRLQMEDLYTEEELRELVFYVEKGLKVATNKKQIVALYFARIQLKTCWNTSPLADIELSDIYEVELPIERKAITVLTQKPRKGYAIDCYDLDGRAVNSVMHDILYVRDRVTKDFRVENKGVNCNYLFIYRENTDIKRLDQQIIVSYVKSLLKSYGCSIGYNSMRIRKSGANFIYREVAKGLRDYESHMRHDFSTYIKNYQRINEVDTQQALHNAVDVMQKYFTGREISPEIKILMKDDMSLQKTPTGECASLGNDNESRQYNKEHKQLYKENDNKSGWCSDYLACIWCKHFRTVADSEHVWQLLSYREYVLADMAVSISGLDNNDLQKDAITALHERVNEILKQLGAKNQLVIAKGKELLKSKGMHPFWSFAVTATSSQGVMQ